MLGRWEEKGLDCRSVLSGVRLGNRARMGVLGWMRGRQYGWSPDQHQRDTA